MKNNFEIEFLTKALKFSNSLDKELRMKIFADMRYSQKYRNSKFFKKLNKDIWDKTRKSMVIATHGIHKKDQKTPVKEIETATKLMNQYYG